MFRLVAVVLLLVVSGGLQLVAQTSPKLVVILVVDQMRADYLTRFDQHWRAGLRTLVRDGAVFDNARYPYLTTVTCAGHATIGTGAFPHTHGMVSNGWWRRDEGRSPECTADPTVAGVSYGAAVQTSSSPKQLRAPTLADELREQKPGARVVAISLKSRSAITLAGQAGDAVVWFDDGAGTFTTSRAYSAAPVPAVRQFIDANPYEKEFGRTWTLLGAPDSYLSRDSGPGERPPTGWTALFPHTIPVPAPAGRGREGRGADTDAAARGGRAAGPAPAVPAAAGPTNPTASPTAPAAPGATGAAAPGARAAGPATAPAPAPAPPAGNPAGLWRATPFADAYLGRMALALADGFELGRRNTTDFLSVSFSTLDDVGHSFGPESREVEDVLRHLDVTLGTLIQGLDTRVGRANYVLGLSADHGVAPFTGLGRGGRVHTEDVRDRIDEVLTGILGPLQKGSYVEAVNSGYIYFAKGVFDRLKATPTAVAAVQRAVEDLPGVARIVRSDEISDRSRDPVIRAAALSHLPERTGDLLVVVEPYWTLLARATQSASHGTMHDYDTHVPLIFLGGAFKSGHRRTAATPADLAPTLAQAVGVRLPKAEGRALTEILR